MRSALSLAIVDDEPKAKRPGKPPTVLRVIQVTQMLTPEELAAWLHIDRDSIYDMVARAKSRIDKGANPILFRYVGRLLRFDYDEIVAWTKKAERQ